MAEGIQIKNLPSTTAIKQGDTMTIVQDKQNKQLALDVFANESDLATLSPLENRCDEVKAKIEVDEYSAEITTSQSMSKIGTDDSGANLHENVLDGAFELCVLKGHTKYRDIDTGEILENFEESRNLELITVRMPILSTVGKNLINPSEFISNMTVYNINVARDGDCFTFNGESSGAYDAYITVQRNEFGQGILLRKNKTYCIGYEVLSGSATGSMVLAFKCVNSSNSVTWKETSGEYLTYTPKEDIYVSWLRIHGYSSANYDNFKIRVYIEEATSPTSYESYKTSILSCNEEVELRGIGDVRDTLNCLTGEMTKRIGEVVLDGSEDGWRLSGGNTNELRYGAMYPNSSVELFSKTLNDKFINGDMSKTDILNYIYAPGSSNGLVVTVDKTKLETVDITGFKKWLSQNPITVQYQLATESIKTVGLSGYPFSYENGHVILSSGSTEPSLTPTVTYKVPVSRVGQIASNTKSNLRQTIKLDQLEVLVYQSLINAEYENLLVQNSAESATSFTTLSTNDPKDELYYMLKHLIEEDQPVQNMLDKINLFYLYGLLSDEHYFDLLLGGEEDVY